MFIDFFFFYLYKRRVRARTCRVRLPVEHQGAVTCVGEALQVMGIPALVREPVPLTPKRLLRFFFFLHIDFMTKLIAKMNY